SDRHLPCDHHMGARVLHHRSHHPRQNPVRQVHYYSIIMVTHNMQQAARVSDKTAFFLNGYVNEYDDTDKIFSNPADKQTEDYISGRFG
ncbi:MAG: hypothetical protein E7A45_10295, partial [Staphylococcus epidermidis]|nr:hypothetical protein [Staphylococcus epidermidis]